MGTTNPSVSAAASSAMRRVWAKSGETMITRPTDALTRLNSLPGTKRLKTASRSANSRSIAARSERVAPPTRTSQPIAVNR